MLQRGIIKIQQKNYHWFEWLLFAKFTDIQIIANTLILKLK